MLVIFVTTTDRIFPENNSTMKISYTSTLLLLLFSICATAQTDLSNFTNVFSRVTAFDGCEGTFQLDAPGIFAAGDRAILIQMKGATLFEGNNAQFGDVNELNNAGAWEIVVLAEKVGNIFTLQDQPVNDYDPAGRVQLVSFPEFAGDAVVNTQLNAVPWNGTIGGVLAFSVTGDLLLNADIRADGAGFRGAEYELLNANCNYLIQPDDYFYDFNNWRGATKGEGVADFITDKEKGRGHWGNGGGGGNDHNSGGGGGSNSGSGGSGGEQTPDSFFKCKGFFPGIGGTGLNYIDRVFLGGGGGGGHTNNANVGSGGADGGGIVLVDAQTITAGVPDAVISANGLDAEDTTSDGAGGGGAGGTLLITGLPGGGPNDFILEARGGRGGNTAAPPGRCFGPGGGGGGGSIVVAQADAGYTFDRDGGSSGIVTNPNSECTGDTNGATSGLSGGFYETLDLIAGTLPNVLPVATLEPPSTVFVCENGAIEINTEFTYEDQLEFQWQIFQGGQWVDLTNTAPYSQTNTTSLAITPASSSLDNNQYRIVATRICDGYEILVSTTLEVLPTPTPVGFLSTDNGDGTATLIANSAANVVSFTWIFDGMTIGTGSSITYDFGGDGTFPVTLQTIFFCGQAEAMQDVILGQAQTAPQAVYSTSTLTGCAPLEVQFTDESTGGGLSYEWTFHDGTVVNVPNPTFTYTQSGTYQVVFSVLNNVGSDNSTEMLTITILDAPAADFGHVVNDLTTTVSVINPVPGTTYTWDFGDSQTATGETASNTYAVAGNYEITLTATNVCGTLTNSVNIDATEPVAAPTAQFSFGSVSGCAPLEVQFTSTSTGTGLSYAWTFSEGTPANSTLQDPVVSFDQSGMVTATLTVTNSAGVDQSSQQVMIDIVPDPEADFTSTTSGLSINVQVTDPQPGTTYTWDYGDSGVGSGTTDSYTYAAAGSYAVSLTATNACGSVTSNQSVTVSEIVLAPTASFTTSDVSGCAPLEVQFTSTSTGDNLDYSWTFSGGNPANSTLQNPVVSFTQSETVTAQLTVTNSAGNDVSSQNVTVVVFPEPVLPAVTYTTNGTVVTATIPNPAPGSTYTWMVSGFGSFDGTQISFDVGASGDYSYELMVQNTCGALSDNGVFEVQNTVAAFNANFTSGCAPFFISFENQSLGDYDEVLWIFEGGVPATSTEENPSVIYNDAGEYDVTLTLTEDGVSYTLLKEDFILLFDFPVADFSYEIDGGTVQFTNLSQFGQEFTWDFGDGSAESSESDPVHTYANNGLYEVNLLAANEFCGSGLTLPILIDELVATNEPELGFAWFVQPNPVSDRFFIASPEAHDGGRLLDIRGVQVAVVSARQNEVAVQHLPAGLYLLELRFGSTISVQRVVVQP